MKDSIILLSGGMDSTVLFYEFFNSIKLAVSFDYGSKHNDQEYKHAKIHTQRNNIEHIRIDVKNIFQYFKSDLLQSGNEIPEGHYEDVSMKKTVVSFRNGIMLSIITGIAESNNLNNILIANHFGDHAIYPDCRENFITSMSDAIKKGTWSEINLLSPYKTLTKREIGVRGKELNVNFSETYSCYKGNEIHCGKCGTCVERIEALDGFDNTKYEDIN